MWVAQKLLGENLKDVWTEFSILAKAVFVKVHIIKDVFFGLNGVYY